MNLLIIEKSDLLDIRTALVADDRARHLIEIKKVKLGTEIAVGLIDSWLGKARVVELQAKQVKLEIIEQAEVEREFDLTLLLALPRPQLLKKVLQIAGMWGVKEIIFSGSEKVEKSYFQSIVLEPQTLKKHLVDGMSQGVNIFLPQVRVEKHLKQALELIQNTKDKFLAEKTAEQKLINFYVHNREKSNYDKILVALGPEGGFMPSEIDAFVQSGFLMFNISPYVLRVDVALSAALAQLYLARSSTINGI
ncbi:RsmE family RNA methyltransferase [bacterium]|nr:RsmE family RNA methyltransferase [bacterium]